MGKEHDEFDNQRTRFPETDDDKKTGINDLVDEGGGTDRTPTGVDEGTITKELQLPTQVDQSAITREQMEKTGIFAVDKDDPTQVFRRSKPTAYAEPLDATRRVAKTIHDETNQGVSKTLADTLTDEADESMVDDKLKTRLSRTRIDATLNEDDEKIKTTVNLLFPTVMELKNNHTKAVFWRWFTEVYSPNPGNPEAGKQLVNFLSNVPQDEPDKKAIRKLLTKVINWSQTIN